ncbi:hypothetical protein N7532_004574 [Penicillium argentinense]|uniref:Secreted protein n=1 Tax=Penicillium argentinense TaxID=1131581 RepID=A0A9W9FQ66_9EURO|nr:uncharacterized protein N7532_004574 [Penicillium argentinense]KAJ5104045.1 hypothetical protein N7532_004574 [Penicillium argentinense]
MRCVQTCLLVTAALSGHLSIRFQSVSQAVERSGTDDTNKSSRRGVVFFESERAKNQGVTMGRDGEEMDDECDGGNTSGRGVVRVFNGDPAIRLLAMPSSLPSTFSMLRFLLPDPAHGVPMDLKGDPSTGRDRLGPPPCLLRLHAVGLRIATHPQAWENAVSDVVTEA